MSKHLLGVVAVCVLGMLVGPVLAQEEGGERRRRAGADRARAGAERRRPGGDRARGSLERLTTALKLTEKQQAPVQQALETYRKEMANWTQEKGPAMRELYQQARQARQDGKDDEARAAMEKLRALSQERQKMAENLLTQLKDHLTEEQMTTARRLLVRGGSSGRTAGSRTLYALMQLQRLDLTPEQRTKVDQIIQEAYNKVLSSVLTAEQRKRLEQRQREMRERPSGRRPAGAEGRERRPRPEGRAREGRTRGGDRQPVIVD